MPIPAVLHNRKCRLYNPIHLAEPVMLYSLRYWRFRDQIMNCPYCDQNKNVIKAGLRDTQKGSIQRYRCKNCSRYFSDSKQKYSQYPLNVIMYTLEQYNRGYPVEIAKKRTGKKYQYSPPVQTIYSWIQRYKPILTFLKLRKNYNIRRKRSFLLSFG